MRVFLSPTQCSIPMNIGRKGDLKLSKMERKFLRKQSKARHVLLKHEGIQAVCHSTQSLVVANGGLGNGVSRKQLLLALEKYGSVEALLMPPNKPYAFVTYKTTEESRKAYAALNGKAITDDAGQTIVLYLNFVEKAQWKKLGLQALPPGLLVVEEIISPEEEKMLLESVNWTGDTDSPNFQKSLKHRRVKHFGYEFHYENNTVDKDKPLPGGLPDICNSILEKWLKEGYIKHKPDQLTINQYEPGHGIPAHIDTHSAFEDEIISLSLGSEIVMDFKHPEGVTVQVMLPRRSLLVMTGESRYLWTHGITPRKFDTVQASEQFRGGIISGDIGDLTLSKRGMRTSFTFRKVRRTPCNCSYSSVCDRQRKAAGPSLPGSSKEASRLEREHVHLVYDEIARHFSSTRHSPWPRIVAFLRALPSGSIVADIGCGNGKYLGVSEELYMVGCDRSQKLVDICRERQFQALVCDALAVPMRSGSCDACISIAVVHHFSTAERRVAALQELARLLRPGGQALIYVWAMEQEYKNQKSKYLKGSRVSPGDKKEINSDTSVEGLPVKQVPEGGTEDPAPLGGTEDPAPLGGTEDPAPLGGTEDPAPLGGTEDPAPLGGTEDPAPLGGTEDPAPSVSSANNIKDGGLKPKKVPNSELPVHTNRTSFHSQDVLVPWHLKGNAGKDKAVEPLGRAGGPDPSPVFHRYYHVFRDGELEASCKALGDINVLQSYYDQGNWCVVLQKV